MFFEFGCSGQSETTWFHGLSAGKTSRAEQMASASGVQKRIGLVIGGILAARMRASRAGSLRDRPLLRRGGRGNALGRRPEIDACAVPIVPVMW